MLPYWESPVLRHPGLWTAKIVLDLVLVSFTVILASALSGTHTVLPAGWQPLLLGVATGICGVDLVWQLLRPSFYYGGGYNDR